MMTNELKTPSSQNGLSIAALIVGGLIVLIAIAAVNLEKARQAQKETAMALVKAEIERSRAELERVKIEEKSTEGKRQEALLLESRARIELEKARVEAEAKIAIARITEDAKARVAIAEAQFNKELEQSKIKAQLEIAQESAKVELSRLALETVKVRDEKIRETQKKLDEMRRLAESAKPKSWIELAPASTATTKEESLPSSSVTEEQDRTRPRENLPSRNTFKTSNRAFCLVRS